MSVIEQGYKRIVRPQVFAKSEGDPEIAHEWGLQQLEKVGDSRVLQWLAQHSLMYSDPMDPGIGRIRAGLTFPNPLGLAAGFDKDARVIHAIPKFGWGFCTLGAVLRNPQSGNPSPRMWRSQELQALCNWMGFNSAGVATVRKKIEENIEWPPVTRRTPIILNIGKNKDVPVEQALLDYAYVFRVLWPYVDAAEANPSSPNTPGLRDYQNAQTLKELLLGLVAVNEDMATMHTSFAPRKSIGVKVSPDETDEALQDILDVALEVGINFLTLTNTTVSREGTAGWNIPADRGGVSGPPLSERAFRVLCDVHQELKRRNARQRMTLISVGGITGGDELYRRMLHGADLCEALTAWPFEGPDFVKRSLKRLVQRLRADGFRHINGVVGAAS